MSASEQINVMSHQDLQAWLERALRGEEQLPRLTPDEAPYLGVGRLEKSLAPAIRESLRDGALQLVRQFCRDPIGDPGYVGQLLQLTSIFKNPEAVRMLAQLARRFPEHPHISREIRCAVLAVLVDTPPPQDPAFWEEILKQDRETYSATVLSGILATNPQQAVWMLPEMPQTKRVGNIAALKLDLTWDILPPSRRFHLIQSIGTVLERCGPEFAIPLKNWINSKEDPRPATVNPGLFTALLQYLAEESESRARTPKLCPC